MNKFYRVWLVMAAAALPAALIALFMGKRSAAAIIAAVLFLALALGIRGTALKGLSFTMWIIAAVVTSMLYPACFTAVGGFKLSFLIVPLMQIIMFGMGTTMSMKDFVSIVRMPKGVIVGMLCQFTIMPFVGFFLAKSFGFPAEIAAGVVLIGSVPCGLASGLALQMGKVATVGLAPAIFGPWMNISGSTLANYWRTRPVSEPRTSRKQLLMRWGAPMSHEN